LNFFSLKYQSFISSLLVIARQTLAAGALKVRSMTIGVVFILFFIII
jgi:hypothetical protein